MTGNMLPVYGGTRVFRPAPNKISLSADPFNYVRNSQRFAGTGVSVVDVGVTIITANGPGSSGREKFLL